MRLKTSTRSPRSLAALLVGAVATGAMLIPTAPAVAAPSEDPEVRDAAVFLGQQMAANNNRMPGFRAGSADWGLTIDAIFALAGAGVGKDIVDASIEAIQSDEFTFLDSQNDQNMGAFAKTALALQIAGQAPTVDGQDLVALLRSRVTAAGRVGTNSNHFGQSLSMLALARTDEGVPRNVIDYTLGYQCTDPEHANFGGFGSSNGVNACKSVDGDAVGMLGSSLLAVRDEVDPQVFADAVTWLQNTQRPDGSFATGWSGAGNSNSAGLVAQFAREIGTPEALAVATRTDGYLTALEVGCTQPYAFGASNTVTGGGFWTQWRGALAYNTAAMAEGAATGVKASLNDQWRRASTQAVLGLDTMPGLSQLSTSGMSAQLPPISTCRITGSAPSVAGTAGPGGTLTATPGAYRTGDVAHLGTPGLTWQWLRNGQPIAGADAATYVVVAADAGAAISVRATVAEPGFETTSVTSEPLTAGEPPQSTVQVTTAGGRVHHGESVAVTITGLAPDEKYTVALAGVQVASGTAAPDATATTVSFVVPTGTPTDPARRLVVTGRNQNRVGTATLATVGETTLSVSATRGIVLRGAPVEVAATGLLPDEAWSLNVSGATVASGKADGRGAVATSFVVPGDWGTELDRALVLTGARADRAGRATVTTAAPARLAVAVAKKKVRPHGRQKVTVAGLLPGESVRVKVAGRKAFAGVATSAGTFTVKFKAGGKAPRPGTSSSVKVTATGESRTRIGKRAYTLR